MDFHSLVPGIPPTLILGVIGYFLKRAFEGMSKKLDEIGAKVGDHAEALADLKARVGILERR